LKLTSSASSSFVHPDGSITSKATAKLLNTSANTNCSACYTLHVILFSSSAIIFIYHNFWHWSAVVYCEIQVWRRSVSCLPEQSGGASCQSYIFSAEGIKLPICRAETLEITYK
jgi:hypothetical protein